MNSEKLIKIGLLAVMGWFAALFFFSRDGAGSPGGNGRVAEWTLQDLQDKGQKGWVVVDCYTPSCGPCRRMMPIVEEIAAEFSGKATFARIDVARDHAAASALNVTAVPAFLIFRDGREVDRWIGSREKDEFRQEMASRLN